LVVVYQSTQQPHKQELGSTVDSFYGCLSDDHILAEEENHKEIA
jgi:hypothetical protein